MQPYYFTARNVRLLIERHMCATILHHAKPSGKLGNCDLGIFLSGC